AEYLVMDEEQKRTLFEQSIEEAFPDPLKAAALTGFMTHDKIRMFYTVCSQLDPLVPGELRENGRLKRGIYDPDVFPNLPQDTPYDMRQKAIDDFLGTPVLSLEKIHVNEAGQEVARTTINKYLWLGPTEVFSIDSGKPGPTTLVFSPHFHEDNPRKSFHWTKDIPLQSGRLILLPEAYRSTYILGIKDGGDSNGLHTKAFQEDGLNQYIARRVECLMGLVDGMVGAHDSGGGPFYISDLIVLNAGLPQSRSLAAEPRRPNVMTTSTLSIEESRGLAPEFFKEGPVASPWVPEEVESITEIRRSPSYIQKSDDEIRAEYESDLQQYPYVSSLYPTFEDYKKGNAGPPTMIQNQVPWQIADYSRTKLTELTGRPYRFDTEEIINKHSLSADSATGYMNYHLGKPAMTFEGRKGEEHGQLHAVALYTLLLAFGHQIDSSYEEALKNESPDVDPELYEGLPIGYTSSRYR
ncbi:MAG: hypothetical protein HY541_08005, partial [Deltaproteobacteria bacterium]|nr:hypothetical protein [Deltaproteobacteria bacterium]